MRAWVAVPPERRRLRLRRFRPDDAPDADAGPGPVSQGAADRRRSANQPGLQRRQRPGCRDGRERPDVDTWLSDCLISVAGASRGAPWGPPSPLGGLPPGAPANWLWDPALAVSRGGVALVAWATQESAAEGRQLISRRLDPVAGWTSAERIDGGEARHLELPYAPSLALDEFGNGLAVWDSEGVVAARLLAARGVARPRADRGPSVLGALRLPRAQRKRLRDLEPAGRGLRAPLRHWQAAQASDTLHPGNGLVLLGLGRPRLDSAGQALLVWSQTRRARSVPSACGRPRTAGVAGRRASSSAPAAGAR